MHKPLSLIFLCLFWVGISLGNTQETAPPAQAEEVHQEADAIEVEEKTQDTIYTNPREVLLYDNATIQPLSLDENTIQKFKNDKDFNYKEDLPPDNAWTRFKTWLGNLWAAFIDWILGGDEAVGFWAWVIQALPYIGIAILVGLLVWIFMKIDSGTLLNERIQAPGVLLSDDEELIKSQDLQGLIDKALIDKNYRLAIRYYYLLILQQMSGKELIDWQVQKTNHDYIFEIQDQNLRSQFRTVTDLYDYIWYGNFEVDESAFAKAETPFNTLKKQL